MKIHFISLAAVLITFLFSVLNVQANEPLWTDAERSAKSDAVFTGIVQSVRKVRELNEQESLFSATVKVTEVRKNHSSLANQEITLYFERPKDGKSNKRCPAYVELSEKQSATFFVRIREIGKDKLPFLELGSDVRPIK
jgi:hypothetical protein